MAAPFRYWPALALVAILSVGSVWAASLPLYTGATDAVTLASWGSGSVESDGEVQYADKPSLKVETKNYFEGAYLELTQAADLAPYVANRANGLVVLVVQIPEPEVSAIPGMPPGMMPPGMMPPGMMPPGMMPPGTMPPGTMPPGMMPPGAPPAMPMPGAPQPGMPQPGMPQPGMPGPGMPGMGMPGMGMPGMAAPLPPETMDHLRVVLLTDKGQIDSGALDTATAVTGNPDWLRLVVPLSQFAVPADLTGAKLLGVMLAGNAEGTFNLGQLYLKEEQPPLVAKIEGERAIVVKEGQKVQVKAAPQPGDTKADYNWDIDFSNGLGTDALGPTATVEYAKEGVYLVTLQVADPTGARETRVDQILVVVKK